MECASAPLGQLASWLVASTLALPLASHQYAPSEPFPQFVTSFDLSHVDVKASYSSLYLQVIYYLLIFHMF